MSAKPRNGKMLQGKEPSKNPAEVTDQLVITRMASGALRIDPGPQHPPGKRVNPRDVETLLWLCSQELQYQKLVSLVGQASQKIIEEIRGEKA